MGVVGWESLVWEVGLEIAVLHLAGAVMAGTIAVRDVKECLGAVDKV